MLVPLIATYGGSEYFQIKIVDQQTGRGVPLVRLTTNNHIDCYTDSNGIVAWNEPGRMGTCISASRVQAIVSPAADGQFASRMAGRRSSRFNV